VIASGCVRCPEGTVDESTCAGDVGLDALVRDPDAGVDAANTDAAVRDTRRPDGSAADLSHDARVQLDGDIPDAVGVAADAESGDAASVEDAASADDGGRDTGTRDGGRRDAGGGARCGLTSATSPWGWQRC
jgi:hypothetical protein